MDELIEVAIGVLAEPRDGQWRVLITRRPESGVLGGFWEFPGGKREPGESLARCLTREFEEELALPVTVMDSLPAIDHRYEHGRLRLFPFFCRLREAEEPQALAVSEWRWVSPEALSDYVFPPANAALLDQVRHALRQPPSAGLEIDRGGATVGGGAGVNAEPQGPSDVAPAADEDPTSAS